MRDIFIEDNILYIGDIKITVKYPIKQVENINGKYVILLKIPRVELGTEELANSMGIEADESELIFPKSATGQAMRWSKFKNRDSREIFDIISSFSIGIATPFHFPSLIKYDAYLSSFIFNGYI